MMIIPYVLQYTIPTGNAKMAFGVAKTAMANVTSLSPEIGTYYLNRDKQNYNYGWLDLKVVFSYIQAVFLGSC